MTRKQFATTDLDSPAPSNAAPCRIVGWDAAGDWEHTNPSQQDPTHRDYNPWAGKAYARDIYFTAA